MGLAEDLKALQELREKGELPEAAYESARDAALRKYGAAPSGGFQFGRFVGKYLLVLVMVATVGFLALFVTHEYSGHPTPAARPAYAAQQPTAQPQQQQEQQPEPPPQAAPQPEPRAFPITNGALAIRAGSLSWYAFTVPPGVSGVSVVGHFTATGGIGNDIIVYVADTDGLENLKNGHATRVYYNSQKVTQSEISATLPNAAGTYYLILDNRFSLLTPKAVQVNATLNYMQ